MSLFAYSRLDSVKILSRRGTSPSLSFLNNTTAQTQLFCKTKHRNIGMRRRLVDTEVYRSQNGRKRWEMKWDNHRLFNGV